VVAGTIHPMVAWLERHHVPRTFALIIVFVLVVGLVAVLALVTLPPLIAQISELAAQVPGLQGRIADAMERTPLLRPLARSVREAGSAQVLQVAGEHLVAVGSRVLIIIGETVTVLFLALYFVGGREREQAAVFALVPRRHHLKLARILHNLSTIVGGYVRGQVLTSALMMAFVFLLLTAFGVRNALAIAVFAALTDVLPFIGALLVTAPAVIATLAARGIGSAVAVLVLLALYQELESRVLVPRIYGRVLRLSPVAVIISLLIGASLLGIVGALLALPAAAAIRMVLRELRVGLPGDDIDRSDEHMREEAAQRAFENVTAGAAAAEAAEIATEMVSKTPRKGEPQG
jgi:predicted PurR-regulated permease PerM